MGTNYYLDNTEGLHIGKASFGWAFALHVYPEQGIADLGDWAVKWMGHPIYNEYGEQVPQDEMVSIITGRTFSRRMPVDGIHCIGHGSGPWDLMIGAFS